jgi:hypothetical protein
MKKQHKHKDLIIAWANGEKIQYYDEGWEDCFEDPCWDEDAEYRIKPEVIRYRNVLYKSGNYYYVCAENENSGGSGGGVGLFIKYLTDWIEVEV